MLTSPVVGVYETMLMFGVDAGVQAEEGVNGGVDGPAART